MTQSTMSDKTGSYAILPRLLFRTIRVIFDARLRDPFAMPITGENKEKKQQVVDPGARARAPCRNNNRQREHDMQSANITIRRAVVIPSL